VLDSLALCKPALVARGIGSDISLVERESVHPGGEARPHEPGQVRRGVDDVVLDPLHRVGLECSGLSTNRGFFE
jgi:hypothetical protein